MLCKSKTEKVWFHSKNWASTETNPIQKIWLLLWRQTVTISSLRRTFQFHYHSVVNWQVFAYMSVSSMQTRDRGNQRATKTIARRFLVDIPLCKQLHLVTASKLPVTTMGSGCQAAGLCDWGIKHIQNKSKWDNCIQWLWEGLSSRMLVRHWNLYRSLTLAAKNKNTGKLFGYHTCITWL